MHGPWLKDTVPLRSHCVREPTPVATLLSDATWLSSASTCRGRPVAVKRYRRGPEHVRWCYIRSSRRGIVRVKMDPCGRAGTERILTQSGVPVGAATYAGRGQVVERWGRAGSRSLETIRFSEEATQPRLLAVVTDRCAPPSREYRAPGECRSGRSGGRARCRTSRSSWAPGSRGPCTGR